MLSARIHHLGATLRLLPALLLTFPLTPLLTVACAGEDDPADISMFAPGATSTSQGIITWGREALSAEVTGCGDTTGATAGLGTSLAVTGTTLVAGAPEACSPFDDVSRHGAVVVYDREAGRWLAGDVIRRGTPANGDRFGAAVAFSEPTLVAGAPGANSVEVFGRFGRRFLSEATLTRPVGAPPPSSGSGFGEAVAVGGDTILVGAENANAGATASGVVFAYVRAGADWRFSQIIAPPTSTANGRFGHQLVTDGELAVIASADEVTVYRRGASSLVFQQTLPAASNIGLVLRGNRFVVGLQSGDVLVFVQDLEGTFTLEETLEVGEATSQAIGFGNGQLVVADDTRVSSFLGTFSLDAAPLWRDDGEVDGAPGGASAVAVDSGFVIVADDEDGLASFRRVATNGEACTAGSECLSGFCIDGVCCNSLCGAGEDNCLACSVAAGGEQDGLCTTAIAGTVCREPLGACDAAEVCNGLDNTCPVDVLRSANSVCREAAGPCDDAERCDGNTPTCPRDVFRDVGTVCRASVGACDIVDVCDGLRASCPIDEVQKPGTPCRGRFGVCDEPEVCDGTLPICPADRFTPFGTVCRAPTGQCDAAEVCQGVSADCPGDGFVADGSACVDGDTCTENDTCQAGRCIAGADICGETPDTPDTDPVPFDPTPTDEDKDDDEDSGDGCRSSPTGSTGITGALLALAALRRRRQRQRQRRQPHRTFAVPAIIAMVLTLGASSASAQDADGDTVPDIADRCAIGDDRIDSDADGTPDACDCAPNDATIHPRALDTCDGVDNNCDLRVDRRLALQARGAELVGMVSRGEATQPAVNMVYFPTAGGDLQVVPVGNALTDPIYFRAPLDLRTVGGVRQALVLLDRVPTDGDNDTVVALTDGTRIVTVGMFDAINGYIGRASAATFSASGGRLVLKPLVAPSPDPTFVDGQEDRRFVFQFKGTEGRTEVTARGTQGTITGTMPFTGSDALDPDVPWSILLAGNTRTEAYTISRVEVWQTVPDDDGFPDGDNDGYSETCDCNDGDGAVHPGARETCAFGDEDCRPSPFDEQEIIFARNGAGMLGEVANLIARAPDNRPLTLQPGGVLRIGGGNFFRTVYEVPLTGSTSNLTMALGAGPPNGSLLFGLTDGAIYRAFYARRDEGRLEVFAMNGAMFDGRVSDSNFNRVNLAARVSRILEEAPTLRGTFSGNTLRVQAGGAEQTLSFPNGSGFASGARLKAFIAPVSASPLLISGFDITVPGPDADGDGICDLSDACFGFDGDVDDDNDGVRNICDCNDNNPAIRPGATETCDGVDQDCDGRGDRITRGGVRAELLAAIAQGHGQVLSSGAQYVEELGVIGRPGSTGGRFTIRSNATASVNNDRLTSVATGDRILSIVRVQFDPQLSFSVVLLATYDPITGARITSQQIGVIGTSGDGDITLDYVDDGDGVRLRASPPFNNATAPHRLLNNGDVLLTGPGLDLSAPARFLTSQTVLNAEVIFQLPDNDGDGVCNEVDRCVGADDTSDADTDGIPDGCDVCLGFDGTADQDGDGFPNNCDCDDSDASRSPNAIDDCDGLDNDCDGLIDVHTAYDLRGGELITRLAQQSDFSSSTRRPLRGLAGGQVVEVGPATASARTPDVYYREAIAFQPVLDASRFDLEVDRDTLSGDHDFIVGVSNGSRFFGVVIQNVGEAGTTYSVAPFEAADGALSLNDVTIGTATTFSEAPPYTLGYRFDGGAPRIQFSTAGGVTVALPSTRPADLRNFGDDLELLLVGDSLEETYRFRRATIRQVLIDSDGDNVCDALDRCAGGDDLGPDADNDGIVDSCDVCPLGDDVPDADLDGVPDACDVCPGFDDNADADADAIPDGCDACPDDYANDNDGDGVCDLSDICLQGDDRLDIDGDGVPDACDRCPLDADNDQDEDGVCDSDDLCVGNDNAGDKDGDGFCADVDCDDTRASIHPGAEEICDGFDSDCNGALRADELDSDDDGVIDCSAATPEPISADETGCTQLGGSPSLAALLLTLLGVRRRRRHGWGSPLPDEHS